jgi:hypothetical protein
MKRLFLLTIGFVFLFSGQAAAVTISARAMGDIPAEQDSVYYPDVLSYGDFLIHPNPAVGYPSGDGIDESVFWTFDFNYHAHFSHFSSLLPLDSALLTLTLTPQAGDIATDRVFIGGAALLPGQEYFGLEPIYTDVIQNLPLDQTATIQIELLDYYNSEDILDAFSGAYSNKGYLYYTGGFGTVPMYYQDDAFVTYAQLDLTNSAPVPIPATILLISSGLIGLVAYRKKLTIYF